jgi:hypothetical protein
VSEVTSCGPSRPSARSVSLSSRSWRPSSRASSSSGVGTRLRRIHAVRRANMPVILVLRADSPCDGPTPTLSARTPSRRDVPAEAPSRAATRRTQIPLYPRVTAAGNNASPLGVGAGTAGGCLHAVQPRDRRGIGHCRSMCDVHQAQSVVRQLDVVMRRRHPRSSQNPSSS